MNLECSFCGTAYFGSPSGRCTNVLDDPFAVETGGKVVCAGALVGVEE